MVILNCKSDILRRSSVVKIKLPGFGTIRSHGNKKKNNSKLLAKDRRRKRLEKRYKDLKPNNLLF